jgi:hypothetical protein
VMPLQDHMQQYPVRKPAQPYSQDNHGPDRQFIARYIAYFAPSHSTRAQVAPSSRPDRPVVLSCRRLGSF